MKNNVKRRMGHNIQQKEKKKTGHKVIWSEVVCPLLCCKVPSTETQCQKVTKAFGNFLHARDLQFAPRTSKEALEISYITPNLFVLSLYQSVWWGQRIGWKFSQLQFSPQKLCQFTFSLSLSLKLTEHNVWWTKILWH